MPKKDKAKSAEKKARKAEKQTKKATQKEKKGKAKGKGDDSDGEDVDLEAVLKEYAEQQAQFLKVTEEAAGPPSARSSATLVGSPANANELFLFGGEHYNGALASFSSELFVYQINRAEWRRVTSPNSPLPRSGHAWTRGGNAGGVWLFGGEFSSPKQGTFYHYNDFWRLEPAGREWSRVETKKGPPARSGHRMTYFKNYILLFGGFQDTSQQTKYLQDLWLYDTANYVWHNPPLPPASAKPDPRSSFTFLPHDHGAVLQGGYSRVKTNEKAGGRSKSGAQATRTVLQPMVHQDTWFLKVTPPATDAAPGAPPTVRWERRKRPANAPNPPRAGATMAYHKSRGISFGGVHDVENSEEGIDSEFFDTLFAWNIDRNRFFQLTLRKARGPSKKQAAAAERAAGRRGRGKADEEELLRNLAALEAKGSIDDADAMEIDKPAGDDGVEAQLPEQPVLDTMPHPRFNAQLAVQDDVLYIYGGTYEAGDKEFTFDEMFAIDLGRLDGVKQIFHRDLENWEGSEDEESEDDDDEDEDDGEEDGDGQGESSKPSAGDGDEMESVATVAVEDDQRSEATFVEEEQQQSAKADPRPFPRPFETLRDFYARTSVDWQAMLMQELKEQSGGAGNTVKELRKEAFTLAEERWWDCREEVMQLEDEQEEAGIGEVVSLADKSQQGGGAAGRRR